METFSLIARALWLCPAEDVWHVAESTADDLTSHVLQSKAIGSGCGSGPK